MSEDVEFAHRRILLIDDNPAIHEDFGKIFGPGLHSASALADNAGAVLCKIARMDAYVAKPIDRQRHENCSVRFLDEGTG